MTGQPGLFTFTDEGAPEALRKLWAQYSQLPPNFECGQCAHYQASNSMCLMVGPTSYDWRGEWRACGLWERANV